MSKLDKDLKEVMDDSFSQGEKLFKELIPVIVDEDMDEDEKMGRINSVVSEMKPKSYDDYIHDIKRAFIADGWERKG